VAEAPTLQTLISFLDELLDPSAFSDYAPNGLQVPRDGDEVRTVVTGVSAHGPLLERARDTGADLVLVHHGMFWRGDPMGIDAAQYRRLRLLLGGNMALAAYHLPLDAHAEHGNNAILAERLGLLDVQPFAGIGVHGRLPGDGLAGEDLRAAIAAICDHDVVHIAGGREPIRTISIVSGAATDHLRDALALGLDAHLTGEPAERAYALAHDARIHFFAAGHHATETFGVRRLGEILEAEFGIRHVHVDVRNPI
jgi:dinuclear metal center YbgI/SA1388 family protein